MINPLNLTKRSRLKMPRIKWTLKRILLLLGTLLGIGTIVSCYGTVITPEIIDGPDYESSEAFNEYQNDF